VRAGEQKAPEDLLAAEFWARFGGEAPAGGQPPRRRHPAVAAIVIMVVTLMVASGAMALSRALSNQPGGSTRASASESRGVVRVLTRIGGESVEVAGTGIVLTRSGVILTNNHVISGGTSISVTDAGTGKSYPATVLGYDTEADVALLQATGASNLETAVVGSSSDLAIGAAVVAVGNAGGVGGPPVAAKGTVIGLDQTVSALNEVDGTSETLTGLVETSANVVSGDSGGPLLNAAGQVVAMDTMGSSGLRVQSETAVGFAIPINSAVDIANEIRSGRGAIGVHIGPSALLGVGIVADAPVPGALVASVFAGTPAARVGLRAGDIIVSIGGLAVESTEALKTSMARYGPGAEVVIRWVDPAGALHSATARLVPGPPL